MTRECEIVEKPCVLASTGAKPPSTDNSIPVMKLLSSDARNTAAALAKTIFDVLRIMAVFLAPSRGMKRARKGQRQNDSVDLSVERDPKRTDKDVPLQRTIHRLRSLKNDQPPVLLCMNQRCIHQM